MIKPGHIEITDKVYFVFHELEKPDSYTYERARDFNFDCSYYQNEIKEYEASKRTVEVSNVFWSKLSLEWLYGRKIKGTWENGPKNNQLCQAEVNGTAKIIELTKQE